jgi:hypothetical protein
MARQPTPMDIMGDLMQSSEPASNKAIEQHRNNDCEQAKVEPPEAKQENHKTIKLSKNKAIKQDNGMEILELKEKATFNLSQSTLLKLEDAWIQLKRQLKGEQRITKTAIVEMALEICIKELAQKETESSLYRWLAQS